MSNAIRRLQIYHKNRECFCSLESSLKGISCSKEALKEFHARKSNRNNESALIKFYLGIKRIVIVSRSTIRSAFFIFTRNVFPSPKMYTDEKPRKKFLSIKITKQRNAKEFPVKRKHVNKT